MDLAERKLKCYFAYVKQQKAYIFLEKMELLHRLVEDAKLRRRVRIGEIMTDDASFDEMDADADLDR